MPVRAPSIGLGRSAPLRGRRLSAEKPFSHSNNVTTRRRLSARTCRAPRPARRRRPPRDNIYDRRRRRSSVVSAALNKTFGCYYAKPLASAPSPASSPPVVSEDGSPPAPALPRRQADVVGAFDTGRDLFHPNSPPPRRGPRDAPTYRSRRLPSHGVSSSHRLLSPRVLVRSARVDPRITGYDCASARVTATTRRGGFTTPRNVIKLHNDGVSYTGPSCMNRQYCQ